MSDNQYKAQEQEAVQTEQKQQSRAAETSASRRAPSPHCPGCGHVNPDGAAYCEECGAPQGGTQCPHCGHTILPGGDMCEACGTWLHNGNCAFCSSPLENGAAYCGECGNPTGGIECHSCGTVSFFDYCPKCHAQLTEQAAEMVELLKEQPAMREFLEAKQEYADIDIQIKTLEKECSGNSQSIESQATDMQTINDRAAARYIDSLYNKEKQALKQESAPDKQKAAPVERTTESGKKADKTAEAQAGKQAQKQAEMEARKAELQAMKEKQAEINQKQKQLEALKSKQKDLKKRLADPPAVPQGLSDNQQIRRIQMAIKPPVVIGWLCNAYGNIHQAPMNCARPGAGGKWLTE